MLKMAKDRERVCEYYINEGNCRKGHEGTFRKCCQTCYDYKAKKGAIPRRKDLRKEKREKWMQDDRNFS